MSSGDSSPPPEAEKDAFPPGLAAAAAALAATVVGEDPATERAYGEALRRGTAPRALAEVAAMAHLFGGFPRAIQGLRALGQAARAAGLSLPLAAASDTGGPARSEEIRGASPPAACGASRTTGEGTPATALHHDRGRRLFTRIYGAQADAVLASLRDVVPEFEQWILEHAYGQVLARPELPPLQRELLAIAALTVLHCPAQLRSHVRGALRLGAPPAAVLEAVDTVRSLCRHPEHHPLARRIAEELVSDPGARA